MRDAGRIPRTMGPVVAPSARAWAIAIAACLMLLGWHGVAPAGGAEPQRKPNILFLLTDDHRADTIGALGNPLISTPNLDGLVRRGTVFTRALSPFPLCVPSRAEILTGCSGYRNGVLPPMHDQPTPGLVTWPEALRSAGYQTAWVGKWHISGRPRTRGYDRSLGLFSSGVRTPPPQFDTSGRVVTGYAGWVFQDDEGHLFPEKGIGLTPNISAEFADAAIALIEQSQRDRPFFVQVNFTAPHDPLYMPPGFEGRYKPADMPVPPNFLPQHPFDHGNFSGRDEELWPWPRTKQLVRNELALYYAIVTHLDQQIGRILDALERTGEADNTIVVFSADHGLAIGSHGLRGKQNMYEHTVTVPMIFAGPGVPKGERRNAQVYLRELYPTLCEMVGVEIPATVEGLSFAAIVKGQKQKLRDEAFGYFADSQRMIRGDRWKYMNYPKAKREQLFDLAQDPFELHDLSAAPQHSALRETLRKTLADWQVSVHDPIVGR